jgi:hypothetical protein
MPDAMSDLDSVQESIIENQSKRQIYKIKHKLQLPSHFKHLFNLFTQVDIYLNLLKRRKGVWQVTL